MSLNGLDNPAVQEAYQQSLAEPAGWFLLKYASRDSVELLGRGKGGVHEARMAIGKYEEPSPLYGLIVYRRRKVLIKYIPSGTSRLLQARTAVHFQDIIERFSPYETLLEITTAEGLNDTSLAASFPLHTASPSASSHRLHEISEDGEDLGAAPRRPPPSTSASSETTIGAQRYKMERRNDPVMRTERQTPSIQVTQDGPTSPLSSPLASPPKTHMSQFLVREDSGQRSITSLGSAKSAASIPDRTSSDVSGRSALSEYSANDLPRAQSQSTYAPQTQRSSQTSQPSLSDRASIAPSQPAERMASAPTEAQPVERPTERASLSGRPNVSERQKTENDDPYDLSKFDSLFKPKIKLGPRPVAPGERTKRPTVASIAGVPATYRPTQKKQEPAAPVRPKSQGPGSMLGPASLPTVLPTPPPIPEMPEYNPRPLSRGSVKSLPSHKSTAMTPDKIRLMKAVELRKKQLRKSNPQEHFVPPKDDETPAVPKVPEAIKEDVVKPTELEPLAKTSIDDDQTPSKKADSGIEMDYDRQEKRSEENPAEEPRTEPLEHHREHHEEISHLPLHQPATAPLEPREESPEREVNNEPTMSLDMLGDAPKPSVIESIFADGPNMYGDSLGIVMPQRNDGSVIPDIAMVEASRPNTSARDNDDNLAQRDDAALEELEGANDTDEDVPEPPPKSARRQNVDLAKRRRGIVEPLNLEPHGEGDYGSDDDFLEELHSATVQDAKPVTMARSPVAPSFARRPSAHSLASEKSVHSVNSVNIQRKSSNPLQVNNDNIGHPSPELHSSPSIDRSHLASTPPMEKNDPTAGLKRNVSYGIQRRIQTLAEVSSRESSPSNQDGHPRPLSPETSPNFLQRDQRSSMRSPPPRSRLSSYRSARQSARVSGYPSPDSNAVHHSENQPVWNVQRDPVSSRESVSVTARIIRPTARVEEDATEQQDGHFEESQLVINHRRASQQRSDLNKALPPLNTTAYQPLQKSESLPSVSSSPAKSPTMTRVSTEHRTLHSANRKSFARHKQPLATSSPTVENTTSLASTDENVTPKESSRTSRFFKRMSNLGGNKWRQSTAQQSLGTNSSPVSNADVASLAGRNASPGNQDKSDTPPGAMVGDLNVQFPDSLLWKRRIVEIDDAGYVIFSMSQALDVYRRAAKKFHLSEFNMPYAPDLDRQELPHSVMLDFVDGTTLQTACEDGMTHRQVLHVLRTYWKAWTVL